MALDANPPAEIKRRLRAMPAPQIGADELGSVERTLAGGFAYLPGLSLGAHQVLARRALERELRRGSR